MGWISNLLASRELSRYEELARTAPAPSVFMRLGQLYEEMGEREKARQVYRRGAEAFPNDEQLRIQNDDVAREEHALEKKRLKSQIDRFPNPSLYARLGELYLLDDDLQSCGKICRQSLKQYPKYGGTHLLLARMALKVGRRDEAYESLLKARELDKVNYGVLMMLIEEQLRRGERDDARASLNEILQFAPGDERATEMLQDFDALAERYEEEARRAAKSMAETHHVNVRQVAGAKGGAEESLDAAVERFANLEGVDGVILIDTRGLVVASRFASGADEDLTAALVANIFRASSGCEGPFGIGPFEEGVLESDAGSIYVLNLKGMMAAVLAADSVKPGMLQRALHAFASKVETME
jgi:predicted regulator of Ras-like GTPase activity (Roadblock/LC7/MglB family)/Flp pilus assembly protein TadD